MSTIRPQLKPYIEGIHAYVPGSSKAADGKPLVKLSANENPLGCSPAALEALHQAGAPQDYPDPGATALREAIGALHGNDPARIVCGSGSGELLSCAVQAYAGQGDSILFSRFSFSLYPILAQKVGARAVLAEDDGLAASVDNMLAALDDSVKVVLLDNPNNPVGTFLPRSEIERLHAALPGDVLLVVDQAYGEYVDPAQDDGGLALAERAANVLVTRTFSKAYGLAAERIGWATGAPHLVDALHRLRGPFNVTASGQRAALAALGDQDFVRHSRAHNAAARARFVERVEQLGNHGLRSLPSEANFVLVAFDGEVTARAALAAIAGAGFAVRHLGDLDHCLRITIGTDAQMDAIADVLDRLTGAAHGD